MEDGRFNGAIEVHVDLTPMARLVRQIVGHVRSVIFGFVALMAAVSAFVILQSVRDRKRELSDVRSTQTDAARAQPGIRRLNAELEDRATNLSGASRDGQDELDGTEGLTAQA